MPRWAIAAIVEPRLTDQMPWKVRSEALKPNQLAPVNHTVRPSRSTIRLPSVRSQSVPAPLVLEDELLELDELLLDELELLEELDEELLLELDELELEELELLLDEELELLELELDELLDEVPELEDELLDDELELEVLELLPLIVPVEAVRVTRSSLAPSSRRLIRSV
jgi:hypothetical protein